MHTEFGLISNDWRGQKSSIAYEEIGRIVIQPYIDYPSLSDPSDEKHFSWRMVFVVREGDNEMYRFGRLYEENVERAQQIKAIAVQNNIPFVVEVMSTKEREWFDYELTLLKLEKEPFYDFFEIER